MPLKRCCGIFKDAEGVVRTGRVSLIEKITNQVQYSQQTEANGSFDFNFLPEDVDYTLILEPDDSESQAYAHHRLVLEDARVSTYPADVAGLGAIAHYRMGESSGTVAVDSIGVADGTYQGSPTLGVSGLLVNDLDTAVDFDGSDDYVNIGNSVDPFSSTNNFTISAVVKVAAYGSDAGSTVVSIRVGGENILQFAINNSTHQVGLSLKSNDIGLSGVNSAIPVPVGVTVHVACGYDYDNDISFVAINGVRYVQAQTVKFNSFLGKFRIAKEEDAPQVRLFNGTIDEVTLFATALTPAQVRFLYLSYLNHTPPVYPEGSYPEAIQNLSPVAYYRLGESSGTTAVDETFNYNGTYVGAPTLGTTGLLSGDEDKAVDFDGSSKYVKVLAPNFEESSSQGSIFASINSNDVTDFNILVSSSDEGSLNSTYLHTVINTGELRWYVNNGGVDMHITGTKNVCDGVTHHVGVVSDGTELKFYIDGLEDPISATVGTNNGQWFEDVSNRDHLLLGALIVGSASYYFNGTLDEVAIFDTALTLAQVQDLYLKSINHTTPIYPVGSYSELIQTLSPALYYTMSGTELVDEQGLHSGTYYGNPTHDVDGLITTEPTGKGCRLVPGAYTRTTILPDKMVAVNFFFTQKKVIAANTANTFYIASYRTTASANYWRIYTYGNQLKVLADLGATTKSYYSVHKRFEVDVPYMITFAFDGTDSTLYINGDAIISYAGDYVSCGGVPGDYNELTLGTYSTNTNYTAYSTGDYVIDEFTVFDYPLSEATITALYNKSNPLVAVNPTYPTGSYEELIQATGADAFYRFEDTGYLCTDEFGGTPLVYSSSLGDPLIPTAGLLNNNNSTALTMPLSSFMVQGKKDRTIAAISFIFVINTTADQTIYSLDDGSTTNNLKCYFGSSRLRAILTVGGTTLVNIYSNPLQQGRKYHAAILYNGTQSEMYIDGVVQPTTVVGNVFDIGVPTRKAIGCRLSGATYSKYLNGSLDEVAEFPVALTPAEVQAQSDKAHEVQSFPALSYEEAVFNSVPVAFWRLQETSGESAKDEMGYFYGEYVGDPLLAQTGYVRGSANAIETNINNKFICDTAPNEIWASGASVELWFNILELNATVGHSRILSIGNTASSSDRIHITNDALTDQLSIVFDNDTIPITYTLVPNNWVHLVLTLTADKTYTLYINGTELATGTTTLGTIATKRIEVGEPAGKADAAHKMLSSHLSLYDRPISEQEVRNHYLLGREYHQNAYDYEVISAGASGYYLFNKPKDELSGTDYTQVGALTSVSALADNTEAGGFVFDPGYIATTKDISNNFTIEVWAKPTAFPAYSSMAAIGNWLGFHNNRVSYHYSALDHDTDTDLNLNQTYHVVLTHDEGDWVIYIDGVANVSGTGAPDATGLVGLGVNNTSGEIFQGTLSNFAIYHRALTAAEVLYHYQVGTTAHTPVAGNHNYAAAINDSTPTAWWKLDETTGTIAVDQTGNHNGTYTNSPTLGERGHIALIDDTSTGFDRTSSNIISVPDDDTLSAVGTPFSIEFWFRRTAVGVAVHSILVAKLTETDAEFRVSIRNDQGNKIQFVVCDTNTSNYVYALYSAIDLDKDYHCVASFDGVNSSSLSVALNAEDKVQVNLISSGVFNSIRNTTAALTVGDENSTQAKEPFNGTISNVAYYPRVLTDYEIAKHYMASLYTDEATDDYNRISGTTDPNTEVRAYIRSTGAFIASVLSDAGGNYSFDDLPKEADYDIVRLNTVPTPSVTVTE